MPIDIAALATTVVMSYLLPYVKDGAKKIAEALTEKASQATIEYMTKVSQKVRDRVRSAFSSDDDKTVLSQFEKRPEIAAPLVEAVLKEKLEQDPQLVQELDNLVNAPGPDGKSANMQISDVIGDVGVLYMPGANFQQAEHVRLAGVMKEGLHPIPDPEPTKK